MFSQLPNMAAVRHLGFVLRLLRTTHKEYLMVFIAEQTLVQIGNVVLKMCKFQRYASFA